MKLLGISREADTGKALEEPGLSTVTVTGPESLDFEDILAADGVVIGGNPEFVRRIIYKLRGSTVEAIYLKPVFLHSDEAVPDKNLLSLADGLWAGEPLARLFPKVRRIGERISYLKYSDEKSHQAQTMLKLLRFLYTRGSRLSPFVHPASRFGYVYPFLSANFQGKDDPRAFQILDLLEREGLIEGVFVDRVHHCSKCYSAFLNFREVCNRCRVANLVIEDTIHHFTCGYVGRESDFRNDDVLECPKCSRILRHIGTDYDKPSVVFTCNTCFESFQDPPVEATCFHCGAVSLAENLIVRDVKEYTLTHAGGNFAVYGLHFSLSDLFKDKLDFIEFPVFKVLVAYEVERIRRYSRESCLACLRVSNLQEFYLQFGERRERVAVEMAQIIKENIRKADVVSPMNDSTFVFLLVETPDKYAHVALNRIQSRLQTLVEDNLSLEGEPFRLDVAVKSLPVDKDFKVEDLIARLVV